MKRTRLAALAVPVALLSVPGVALGLTRHHPGNDVFGHQQLTPGGSISGHITVPGANVAVLPYLTLTSPATQTCTSTSCPSHPPQVAHVLSLTADDGAGDVWHGSLDSIKGRLLLPGGPMAAHHSRTYTMTVSMPSDADDRYEDLSLHLGFSWGGVAVASGPNGNHGGATVKGEHFDRRSGSSSSGRVPQSSGSLPFTGFDALGAAGAGAGLIAAGFVLVAAARRRRSRS